MNPIKTIFVQLFALALVTGMPTLAPTAQTTAPSTAPTTAPSTAPSVATADNCAKLTTKAECKSKYAKQHNNCKWDEKETICANPDPDFVQPVPLTACTGSCCELNWRACKGKGAQAKVFERFEGLGKVKKACVYENDYSMTVSTPDGKYYGQCSPKPTETAEEDSEEDGEDLRWEYSQACEDSCCDLDKRACKGKGPMAKLFKENNDGVSPKKMCKYIKDKTKTFKGEEWMNSYGRCIPKDFEEELVN